MFETPCYAAELADSRPTPEPTAAAESEDEGPLGGLVDVYDGELFAEVRRRFDLAVSEYDVTPERCASEVCPEAAVEDPDAFRWDDEPSRGGASSTKGASVAAGVAGGVVGGGVRTSSDDEGDGSVANSPGDGGSADLTPPVKENVPGQCGDDSDCVQPEAKRGAVGAERALQP